MPKKTVFISHSTKNDARVDEIAAALEQAGLDVWVDHRHGITPGTPSWDKAIRKAIEHADLGLFVMSEASLASEICGAECLLIRELDDPLYVLKLEDVPPASVWLYIKQIQYADLTGDFDAGMDALIKAMTGEHVSDGPITDGPITDGPITDGPITDGPQPLHSKFTGEHTLRLYLPYLFLNPMRGRDADLQRLTTSLNGVVQVTGTGGLGKSRLVAEAALKHPLGAVWHRCSPLTSPADLGGLLRQHLRLSNDSSEAEMLHALRLRPGTLVVIDNAEDVTPERQPVYVDFIAKLQAADAHVVLTTRVRWERIKPLKEITPAALDLTHATAIARDFATASEIPLGDEQAATIAEAARLYPRLIEWAVGQMGKRPFARVLTQLRELKSKGVQAALDEMIRKSLAQMVSQEGDAAERLLLRLTACQGTFDYAAVLALKPDAMDEDDLDDALDVLQAWHFLRYDAGEARYSLDAMARLALPAPDDDSRRVHFAHYQGLHRDYGTNNDEDRHPSIAADWDNITAALNWGLHDDAETTVDWVYALQYFMRLHRSSDERLTLLTDTLKVAEAADYQRGQAVTLKGLGEVQRMQNDYAGAVDHYGQALSLFETLGSRLGQANTLQSLGEVHYMQNNYEAALDHYGRAMTLFETVGSRLGQANTLRGLGHVQHMQNDYAGALDHYGQALTLFEMVGDRLGQANTLQSLGDVQRMQNDYAAALDRYEQALPLFETIGDRLGQANTLQSLGDVHYMQDDYGAAIQHYHKALALGAEIGNFTAQLNSLRGLAQAYHAQGQDDHACAYARQLLQLADSHEFFRSHPAVAGWRKDFAGWGCTDL